jgi:hypothetical protein
VIARSSRNTIPWALESLARTQCPTGWRRVRLFRIRQLTDGSFDQESRRVSGTRNSALPCFRIHQIRCMRHPRISGQDKLSEFVSGSVSCHYCGSFNQESRRLSEMRSTALPAMPLRAEVFAQPLIDESSDIRISFPGVFSNCCGDLRLQVNGDVQFDIGTQKLPAFTPRKIVFLLHRGSSSCSG